MVQKNVLNKLGIQANNILKTEKRQAITKPCLQNYDGKSKGGDMKTMKMKKYRSIKRSDVDLGLHSSMNGGHEVVQQLGKPPALATTTVTTTKPYSQIQLGSATKTPSPKKTSPLNNNKSPYGSPNYMKSTSSSEARKENNNPSTSKFHRARETHGKTSSLKKVRTLTKAPSFKHTRIVSNKKVVLCEDIDVQRATCSSTLKDSKFPPYLKLQPGATEAQGTSVMKVCPYTYCSLNGHHHSSAPPLKYFLSSRRKLLKTQKNSKPENLPLSKRKSSEIQVKNEVSAIAETRKEEFFVEIYVPGKEELVAGDDLVQVSETLSDEACSEFDYQEAIDLSDEDRNLTVNNFISQGNLDEEFPAEEVEFSGGESDADVDTVSTLSLDQFFPENSDMEWEDARVPEIHDEKADDSVQSNCGNEEDELVSEFDFLAWKLLPYIHDEIMECLQFSDVDSSSDSEFTPTDDEHIEEQSSDDETIKLGEEPTEEQEDCFLNPAEEVYEAQIEGLISVEEPNENNGDYLYGENHIGDATTEGNNTEIIMEEGESNDCPVGVDAPAETEDVQCFAAAEGQAEGVQSETAQSVNSSFGITADCPLSGENAVSEQKDNKGSIGVAATTGISELEYESDEVKLRSIENDIGEDEVSETEDINTTVEEGTSTNRGNKSQEIRKCSSQRIKNSTDELQNCCNKLKISIRSKKADEGSDEERDFNLRPPNFLPVEPEPDAEKVDLRHQKMDERRNSEEWMLDYALQRTVNQLGPARKRKVSLLVEAFESVLPAPKYEPQMRRSSSTFSHPRPIQACS